ncbi:MAG: hypothetical protein R3D68_18430 [Hyphomicrobiaceae bacterium]
MAFTVGQRWTCPGSASDEGAHLVIGALLTFEAGDVIACCMVTGARQRQPDGSEMRVDIPFLPMTGEALAATVCDLAGTAEVPATFQELFAAWRDDPRGLSYFTVPFEGRLDLMIARQMAQIVGERQRT